MARSWRSSGSLQASLTQNCGGGTVVVGLTLYAYPPESTWKPTEDARGPTRCGSGEPPCPRGNTCVYGVCGHPVPSAPGACLGIGGVFCADAAAVAAGKRPTPSYLDFPSYRPPEKAQELQVFAREGAYAISAIEVRHLAGGATQLVVYDRPFSHGSTDLLQRGASPEEPTPGQQVAASLNCTSPGGDFFLSGLSWALTHPSGDPSGDPPSLGSLQLLCSDYQDVFRPVDRLGCCLGAAKGGCGAFPPGGKVCDAIVADYCRGSGADPAVCGCYHSPLVRGGQSPQCYDRRCAPGNPEAAKAYLPGSFPVAPCAALLQQPLGCDIWKALGEGEHLARGIPVPPACTGGPGWLRTHQGLLFFLLFLCLVLGGVAFAIRRARPPPPPLPPLPPMPSEEG